MVKIRKPKHIKSIWYKCPYCCIVDTKEWITAHLKTRIIDGNVYPCKCLTNNTQNKLKTHRWFVLGDWLNNHGWHRLARICYSLKLAWWVRLSPKSHR